MDSAHKPGRMAGEKRNRSRREKDIDPQYRVRRSTQKRSEGRQHQLLFAPQKTLVPSLASI
jgi:hypothetical protein